MIGVGYAFATIVSQLPPHCCVEAMLLLNLPHLLRKSIKIQPLPVAQSSISRA